MKSLGICDKGLWIWADFLNEVRKEGSGLVD